LFPNQAGKHGKHATSDKTSCDICHNGASAYFGNHQNGLINFSFLAAYTPMTGLTPSFNAITKTCSNISCHGGEITPSWYTGSIDVNNECDKCHGYCSGQYNSYCSGKHSEHVNGEHFASTDCHDTALLAANHFTALSTTVMEGPASATLLNSLNYNGTACHPACHAQRD
jgi:predicted CxxxxCH...CXXCH cytochrome family protein